MFDSFPRQVPIAIVGAGALMPGSSGAGGFWRSIVTGRDLITDVPPTHWLPEDYYDADPAAADHTYARRGAFLSPTDFPSLAYGIPPNTLEATDTTQLLALLVADQVLTEAAGGDLSNLDRDRVSVMLGTGAMELLYSMSNRMQRPVWLKALREHGLPELEAQAICDRIADHYVPWQEATFPGLLSNVVAGRIANRFDLHGTNHTTDAACASSLAAVSAAANELALGKADLAIAGGVDTLNDIVMYMCFSKTPALSPTGDCRPFSAAADGTILGEGLVMLALKRLDRAERDGDRIHAVLRGIGSSSDGRGGAIYAPMPEGQARALRRAYESAGYGPDTVELMEAHGTGTKAGDVAEFTALRAVFAESGRGDRQWCALGSVKSQVGHTKTAAGAASLLKAAFALNHRLLPPTIKVDRPNPALDLRDSPLYVNTAARPWVRDAAHPRRASVSSFGFGGSNFHATLEEYVPDNGGRAALRSRAIDTELVPLSAPSAEELLVRLEGLGQHRDPVDVVAYAAQQSFEADHEARLALIARDADDLADKLDMAANLIRRNSAAAFSVPAAMHYSADRPGIGRLAFVFSGQGSQYLDMGAAVAMHLPQAQQAWDWIARVALGDDKLHRVVFPPPVFGDAERADQHRRLTCTEWAQPALAAQSLMLLAVLDSAGLRADCYAGHSFGELVALHVAGAYDAETLLRLARRRGELMRDAAATTTGAMLAVTAAPDRLTAVLGDVPDVWIANYNSASQTVLSGTEESITTLEKRLAADGVVARRLNAATAFHSPLVAEASAPFLQNLADFEFQPLTGEVYANTDATRYPADPDLVRKRLADHLVNPVCFAEEIEAMYADGVRTFVEVGAGEVLTRLVDSVLDDRPHFAVSLDRKGRDAVTSLQDALGRLAVRGYSLDLTALWAGYASPVRQPESDQQGKQMSTSILGSNHGRRYPPEGGAAVLPEPNPVPEAPAPLVNSNGYSPTVPTEPAAPVGVQSVDPHANPVPLSNGNGVVNGNTAAPDVTAILEVQRQAAEAHARYQQQSAEAHATFQQLMAESQMAFLKVLEGSYSGGYSDGAAAVQWRPSVATATQSASTAPSAAASAVPKLNPNPSEIYSPPAEILPSPELPIASTAMPAPPPAPVDPAPRPGSAQPVSEAVDLEAALLSVVADKTGYPVEMLAAHMDLEADLGVDSIKRVEILSALRTRAPQLPDVDASELGILRTVGEIVERLQPAAVAAGIPSVPAMEGMAQMPAAPGIPVAPMATSAPSPASAQPVSEAVDLEAALLSVVADKTGYPVEMLAAHMDLEADLGVDSIKRVEILSALRTRAPQLPDVDASELGILRTVGEIVERLQPAAADDRAKPRPSPDLRDAQTVSGVSAQLCRSVVRAVAQRPSGLELDQLRSGLVAVTDDGAGVGHRVVERLGVHGIEARVAINVPVDARGVILLDGLRKVSPDGRDSVEIHRAAFESARAVAAHFAEQGGVFVTVADTGGDFGLGGQSAGQPWSGGLAALTRTAAREWPAVAAKAIDVQCAGREPDEIAAVLVAELLGGGDTPDVGLRADGTRLVPEAVEVPVAVSVPRVGSGSVIVASGGGRGVTAAAMLALARAHQPRIALLGRSQLIDEPPEVAAAPDEPTLKRVVAEQLLRDSGATPRPAEVSATVRRVLAAREIRSSLAALQEAGSSVRYLDVDIRDADAVAKVLDQVRLEWGRITGLVHGAGVLADKRIQDKTDEQFDEVFTTKVDGLRALLAATRSDPLQMICLFSSVAAHYGNPGQCDYAMANEVLNQVAAAEQAVRPDCLVRSIGWGPWDGGMVDPTLARHFAAQGVPLIPTAEGAAVFVAELSGSGSDTRLLISGPGRPHAFGNGTRAERTTAVRVTDRSHPYLADHVVAGSPVLPLAMALEWLTGMAGESTTLHNISVLRKVALADLDAGATLQIRQRDGELHLMDAAGTPCYRAEVSSGVSAAAAWRTPSDLRPWDREQLYDGRVLFHGPAFQMLRNVEGVGAGGAVATLVDGRELGWPEGEWRTDPAAVDASLQLALLWAESVLGAATLPMSVAEYRTHRRGLGGTGLRGIVSARDVQPDGARCDIALIEPDGTVRAELFDVALIRRPS
jgi:acyl transferase domain-containing protein/NADP-dependent 3-hydroxy acid dehydrogenase YdfG